MEWWLILTGALVILLLLFLAGLPIFVAFLLINVCGILVLFGQPGFGLFANSLFETTNIAALATIHLFILMGEVLFRSGTVDVLLDSVDKLVGRVLGRQYVVSILLSTVFGALCGAAMGVAAMMGRSLYSSMLRRGYDPKLSAGTILAGASLAPIIPPSVLVIIIGTLADVSIAQLLIAGILPGLVLAALFLVYTLARVRLRPKLAPTLEADAAAHVAVGDKVAALAQMAPFVIIVFFVMGFILLGVATPSEAAATGVVGALVTAAHYRRLSWRMIWESAASAASIGAMVLVIMASSKMFSQLLAFTGSTQELTLFLTDLGLSPALMLFMLLLLPFVLCMFIDQVGLMLVIIPIYQPLLNILQFDPVWFWTLFLINITLGGITPPFGYIMFAFKGAVPGIQLADVFSASWPFVALFVLGMAILAVFPPLATFLPGLLY